MRLSPIIDRLTATCPGLRQVLPALAGRMPSSFPAAFVLPLAETVAANELLAGHLQRVDVRFAVELTVKHAGSAATGGPAQEALEEQREAIFAALAGFVPAAGHAPIAAVAGRLIDFDPGLATWRDEFTTSFYRQAPPLV